MHKHKIGTQVEVVGKSWHGKCGRITRNQKLLGFDYQVQLEDGTTIAQMANELKLIECKGKGDGDKDEQHRTA